MYIHWTKTSHQASSGCLKEVRKKQWKIIKLSPQKVAVVILYYMCGLLWDTLTTGLLLGKMWCFSHLWEVVEHGGSTAIKFLWIGGSIPDIFIKMTLYTSSNVDFVLNSFEIVMVIKRWIMIVLDCTLVCRGMLPGHISPFAKSMASKVLLRITHSLHTLAKRNKTFLLVCIYFGVNCD